MANRPNVVADVRAKRVDTQVQRDLEIGSSVSQATQDALKRIDANIRNAEEKAGTLLVA